MVDGKVEGTHTIESGDTLSQTAEKYGTTVEALAELNGIENPDSFMLARL